MMTLRFCFISDDEKITQSRLMEFATIEHAVNSAIREPGDHKKIQVWYRDRPILSIDNPRSSLPKLDPEEAIKARPPAIDRAPVPRTIDLYSRAPNNSLMAVWSRAAEVIPVSAFERVGCFIVSGYYVIDYFGDAIVVHCANISSDRISVQFMLGEKIAYSSALRTIEPMLLGKVIMSEGQRVAVFELRRQSNFFKD